MSHFLSCIDLPSLWTVFLYLFSITNLHFVTRFEGKHKPIKSYAKNTNSRLDLPYSIAKKTQFNFAFRLLQGEGIEDRIEVSRCVDGPIEEKVSEFWFIFLLYVSYDKPDF